MILLGDSRLYQEVSGIGGIRLLPSLKGLSHQWRSTLNMERGSNAESRCAQASRCLAPNSIRSGSVNWPFIRLKRGEIGRHDRRRGKRLTGKLSVGADRLHIEGEPAISSIALRALTLAASALSLSGRHSSVTYRLAWHIVTRPPPRFSHKPVEICTPVLVAASVQDSPPVG